MNISEIARTNRALERRHVGIRAEHIHITEIALRIYYELGWDPTVEYEVLYLDVPKARSSTTQGMIERCTGFPAFSDWDEPIKRRATYE